MGDLLHWNPVLRAGVLVLIVFINLLQLIIVLVFVVVVLKVCQSKFCVLHWELFQHFNFFLVEVRSLALCPVSL